MLWLQLIILVLYLYCSTAVTPPIGYRYECKETSVFLFMCYLRVERRLLIDWLYCTWGRRACPYCFKLAHTQHNTKCKSSSELAGDLVHKIPVDEHFTEAVPDYEIVWNAIGGILDQATRVWPLKSYHTCLNWLYRVVNLEGTLLVWLSEFSNISIKVRFNFFLIN